MQIKFVKVGFFTSVDSHTQDRGRQLNSTKAEKQEGKINIHWPGYMLVASKSSITESSELLRSAMVNPESTEKN